MVGFDSPISEIDGRVQATRNVEIRLLEVVQPEEMPLLTGRCELASLTSARCGCDDQANSVPSVANITDRANRQALPKVGTPDCKDRMAKSEKLELVEAIEPEVDRLTTEHLNRRSDWYYHDIVPWERGESFRDKPWDVSQTTISENARTSLVLNLLTEDNLPYYHALIEKHMPQTSAFVRWNRLWTAEEGQHAIAIRSYLLTSRNADPYQLEDDRKATMMNGYQPTYDDPTEIFAYTATQELATRVSHRNAGKITDDPSAYELMRYIASDENHHFIFYKEVMRAMLDRAPDLVLDGIYRVFSNFEMPGVAMPNFLRRSIQVAKAGVYNLRIHHDRVLMPLIKDWDIGGLTDLTPVAAERQEKIMKLPDLILRKAEIFEKRVGVSYA